MGTCFGLPPRHHSSSYRDPYYTAGYSGYHGSSYPGEYPVDYYHDSYNHGGGYSVNDGPGYASRYSSSSYRDGDPYYDRPYLYPETLVYSREGLSYAHPVPAVPVPSYRDYDRDYY